MPKKKSSARSKGGPDKSAPTPTADQLYQQAQLALQYDDYDSAKASLKKAVKLEPQNLEVLEAYGSLLAEIGDEKEAVASLQSAVQLCPDAGHEKYMYLGQLVEPGEEAAGYISKGIALLQKQVDEATSATAAATANAAAPQAGTSGGGKKKTSAERAVAAKAARSVEAVSEAQEAEEELRSELCGGLCALAEMRVQMAHVAAVAAAVAAATAPGQDGSDLAVSIDAHAAGEVEQLLERAKLVSPISPEPDQALASLRNEQGNPDAALEALRRSMFRFECAKLLLELDESAKNAIQVLEGLIEEDDSNPATWHLLGLAFYSAELYEEAQAVYEGGMDLLKKLHISPEEDICSEFEDLRSAIEELAGPAATMGE
eukprot:gene14213-20183_t